MAFRLMTSTIDLNKSIELKILKLSQYFTELSKHFQSLSIFDLNCDLKGIIISCNLLIFFNSHSLHSMW